MPNEEVLTRQVRDHDQLSTQEADQERAKEIERLRSMTIGERFQELERLYAEGQKIKRAEEKMDAEAAAKTKVWELWNRLRRAYLGEL